MTRTIRGLWLALIVALVCAPLAIPQASADEQDAQAPIGRFGSCVRGGGKGSVLMLFDRSGSLKHTDPEAARVTSAKYLVEQLAKKLSSIQGVDAQIAIAGFDHSYERSLEWTDLNEANLGAITADLDAYKDRKEGQETDYWKAVDGARRELAARQQGTEAKGCALLVWFSDGGFAIGKRPHDRAVHELGGLKPYDPENPLRTEAQANQAQQRGQEDMCRAGGVADQLRSLQIVSVGIGLAADGTQSFDLMRGFTSGDGIPCGDIQQPKPGEFLMATDIDELIFAFDSVLDETPSKPEETGTCAEGQKPCAEGTRTFVLDGSIGKMQALAQLPVDGGSVLVQSRDGKTVPLSRDGKDAALSGAKLTWKWLSARSVSVELVREGQSEEWVGPWGLVFVAPTKTDELAKSTLRLYGDITPVWTNKDKATVRAGGKKTTLNVGTTDNDGNPIDPTSLSGKTFMSVVVEKPDGSTATLAEQVPPAKFNEPITLDPKDLPVGDAKLRLTLDVTTADWSGAGKNVEGTRLEPVSVAFPLKVLPPEGLPTIPSKVSFGETEKSDPVTITVPLEGEGCAWLGGKTQFTGYPQGLESAKLTSPAKDEQSCSEKGLELTLTPEGVGNGAFVGTTEVLLKSPSAAEGTPVKLEFDLQMSRPASQPVLWGTLVLVTLLGVAIPLGILYLTKWITARIPGNAVLAGQARGPVDDTRAFTDGGLQIDVSRMAIAQLANNRRRVEIAGLTLRTRAGLALTEPGYVVVEQPGRAAGGRGALKSVGDRAMLPLGVQGNWTVALDPERPTSGDVVVTIFTGPGAPGLDELLDDVRTNLRDAVAKLRDGLPPDPGANTPDPWGGGGPAQGSPSGWDTAPAAHQPNPWGNPPGQGAPTTPPAPPAPGQQGGPGGWQNPPSTGWNPPSGGGAGW